MSNKLLEQIARAVRKILEIFLIFLLCIIAVDAQCLEPAQEQVEVLQEQIMIYNFINGLYLDNEQMRFIRSCAKELKAEKKYLDAELEKNRCYQKGALLDLKKEVEENSAEVSKEIARSVHQNEFEIKKLRKKYLDSFKSKGQLVRAVLTDNQLYTIEKFKPCLVPPKGPAKIGQDDSGERFIQLLERIREIPERIYEESKYAIVEKHMEYLRIKHPNIDEKELLKIENSLITIMDKARDFSDKDFMVKKADLAKKIENSIPHRKKMDIDKVIARFLLNEQAIAILEERIKDVSR